MRNNDAFQAALKLLARREHSRLELQQKLRAKGMSADSINAALDQLQADNLLSELRFAESYIRARMNKGYGWLRIQQELQQRGIDAETAEAGLAALNSIDWFAFAEQVYRKRFTTAPADDKEQAKRIRYMQSHGFSYDQIRELLD